MDLKDFIQESILSIVDAVHESQEKAIEKGAIVNPGGLTRGVKNVEANSVWDESTNNFAKNINFDIAITAQDQAKGGAKVKVLSGILGGDVGGEKSATNTMASRLQFSIPILLPVVDVQNEQARANRKAVLPSEK